MRGSVGSGSCRVKVYYRAARCGWDAVLEAGLVAVFTLLLSNSIRRDTCVVVEFPVPGSCGGWMRVVFSGASVKGLSPQETVVEGVMRRVVVDGRWPGARVEVRSEPGGPGEDCVGAGEVLGSPSLCPRCVSLGEGVDGFKPWWLAAGLMVLLDERCWCRGRWSGGDC